MTEFLATIEPAQLARMIFAVAWATGIAYALMSLLPPATFRSPQ